MQKPSKLLSVHNISQVLHDFSTDICVPGMAAPVHNSNECNIPFKEEADKLTVLPGTFLHSIYCVIT